MRRVDDANPEERDPSSLEELLERGLRAAMAGESDSVVEANQESDQDLFGSITESDGDRRDATLAEERYDLGGIIARGGMGIILRAHDRKLGRQVAIKTVAERHLASTRVMSRFRREVLVAARLQHPGIVPVYDCGWLGPRRPYFSMKLVAGRTLEAILDESDRQSSDRSELLSILLKVMQAVACAHAAGFVHRDLKPANIMVGDYGEVMVMDWGLAWVQGEVGAEVGLTEDDSAGDISIGLSVDGSVVGTAPYMSPEQARGEVDRIGPPCDVFALGSILCEVLTGSPAFVGKNFHETRRLAAAGSIASALSRIADAQADPELEEIARICLTVDPEHRPPLQEVVLVLEAWQRHAEDRAERARLEVVAERARGEGEAERAREAHERARAESRARKATVLLSIVGLLVISIATAYLIRTERTARTRERESESVVNAALGEARARLAAARQAGIEDELAWEKSRLATRQLSEQLGRHDPGRELAALVRRFEEDSEAAASDAERSRKIVMQLNRWEPHWHRPSFAERDEEDRRIFASIGIDPDSMEAREMAELLAASSIRDELVAALDVWAKSRFASRQQKESGWRKLIETASLADPDPWRVTLRRAWMDKDVATLSELAVSPSFVEQSAHGTNLLARCLCLLGDSVGTINVLRRAHVIHASDFRINLDLAIHLRWIEDPNWTEIASFYDMARAARPECHEILADFGHALYMSGDIEGSGRVLDQAQRLDPEDGHVQMYAGIIRARIGEIETAVAVLSEAVESFDGSMNLEFFVAELQFILGRYGEAASSLRAAADLLPGHHERLLATAAVLDELEKSSGEDDCRRILERVASSHGVVGVCGELKCESCFRRLFGLDSVAREIKCFPAGQMLGELHRTHKRDCSEF